ncbi:MAG: NfeD family protein [Oculatellaceae cyanobacterium bins.114]|nr:NfeD family protein [Oculatellaceae cyanobacterium bins.114]
MSFAFFPDTPEFLTPPSRARVEQSITPNKRGRVFWQGTSWFARFQEDCPKTIFSGESVMVRGIEGNTLLVMPIESSTSN